MTSVEATDTARLQERRPRGVGRRCSVLAVALLVMTGLVLAACGVSGDDSTADTASAEDVAFGSTRQSSGSDGGGFESSPAMEEDAADMAFDDAEGEFAADEAAGEPAPPAAQGVGTTGAAGAQGTAQLPDLGRDIIYTASVEIASTDVSTATREAIRVVEARGGFLFSQETRGGSGGSSVLTFKVLPDQFQTVLNDLGSVGTVRSQSISADDVSAIVVDLESRINTAEASVERLRDLLDGASELETIATLENQLLQRETTLEQLRGQLRSVRNQVDLATITLRIVELLDRPQVAIETMAYAGHNGGFGCFDDRVVRETEAGEPLTICYRITNVGDTPLIDITVDDPALGASIGSMVVVDGTLDQIEIGESLVLAQETELDEDVRVRTSVSATGIDSDGNEIPDRVSATTVTVRYEVIEDDDGVPGFGETLSSSWNALKTAAIVIALIAVAIAPFLAVLLLLAVPVWFLVRRRRDRSESPAGPGVTPPAPPAPTPPAPTPPVPAGEPQSASPPSTGSTEPTSTDTAATVDDDASIL